MHLTIIFVVWYLNIFMYVHEFMFIIFHLFYFSSQNFPIPICGPWSPYAILHILNMCHSTKYPHPPQMVYINHKTKWSILSFVGGKNMDYGHDKMSNTFISEGLESLLIWLKTQYFHCMDKLSLFLQCNTQVINPNIK
jgi:hypothetical protein